MEVKLFSRSGKELLKGKLHLDQNATVEDLKGAIYKSNKKWHPSRQRLSIKPLEGTSQPSSSSKGFPAPRPVVLDGQKKLSEYGGGKGGPLELVFKDLGPQIGYQTVFFWEYFGPMAIFPLFFLFPDFFYSSVSPSHTSSAGLEWSHRVQLLATLYWTFHYAKRIFETFFVHHFSHATMPIANLFKNCSYYWLFAAFVSFFINHPLYSPVPRSQALIGFSLALLCQLANLRCHVILRGLRSSGSKGGYQIPRGFLFEYITCANYTTEILGWLFFNIATQSVAGYLFMLAGAYQMALWAIAKHRRLQKLFDGEEGREKYPRRWIMIPPFL